MHYKLSSASKLHSFNKINIQVVGMIVMALGETYLNRPVVS